MRKWFAIALFAVLLAPVVAAVAVVGVLLFDRDVRGGRLAGEIRGQLGEPEGGRLRQRHLVPAGFVGWASAHYEVPGAPPLEEEGGFLIHDYSSEGRVETSSPRPPPGRKEYFYRNGGSLEPLVSTRSGGERMIWGDYSQRVTVHDDDGNETVKSSVAGFFVGSREEYREAPPAPDSSPPLPQIPQLPPGSSPTAQ